MPDSYEMPTWGWGDSAHSRDLSDAVRARLQTQLGVGKEVELVAREEADFNVQNSLLDERLLQGLSELVGEENIRSDKMFRVLRSAGKSYPDMISLRGGEPGDVPDAVVQPADQASLREVLSYCSEHAIAVTPFGGGTSVVGGLATVREGFSGAISVDLTNLSGLTSLDAESGLATFAGGTRGPAAEQLLSDHQLTIGHFPQSFEYGTVGGFVATRSAGQSSTGYGRIDKNVIGLTAATPTGPVRFAPMPGTAAGPDLRQLLTGSEGSMGIIDTVTLQVKKTPDVLLDRAWMAPDFATGRAALRELEKAGCAPDVARLSDESETEVSLLLAGDSTPVKALRGYLGLRGRNSGCMMITCFEGSRLDSSQRHRESSDILRRHGVIALGGAPAQGWRKGRFAGPYMRDALMDAGLFVETLETAAPWSQLESVYSAVGDALRDALGSLGGEPLVMCHVSHLYQTGASLYFTFIGRQPGASVAEKIQVWHGVKSAACDAIIQSGGTISHHHAVGRDHAPWLESEIGEAGIRLLRAAKAELDPGGIMNPGRLVLTGS